jgi:predicted nucleic acid-binding protein
MILLDTNVVSELMKPAPEPVVMAWINAIPGATVLLSAVSQAEILLWRSPRAGRKASGRAGTGRPHRV